jgi:CBS domain-containing protein
MVGSTASPVGSLATRPAVFVGPDESLRSISVTLANEVIGAVLVRGPHGAAGIVSERDIVRALSEGADPGSERALDVMTEDVLTVRPGTTVLEVARAMLDNEIRHVVVVDEHERVHIVSARDVLAHLIGATVASA